MWSLLALCRLPTPAQGSVLCITITDALCSSGSGAITGPFTDPSYAKRLGEMVFAQLWGYCGDADIIVREEQTKISSPGVGETMTT